MIIDCHYHLEERVFSIDRLIGEMQKCGIDKVALMGSMIEPFDEPPEFLITVLQSLLESRVLRRIGKALISNFTDKGELKILGTPYPIATDPDNQKVFDTVAKHPDKFLGWVFVNPRGKKNQIQELEKYKDEKGFIGVKAHPFWHHFPPVELAPVAERLSKMSKPLLIHAGFGEEGNFEALLKKFRISSSSWLMRAFPATQTPGRRSSPSRTFTWTFPRPAIPAKKPRAKHSSFLVKTGSFSAPTDPTVFTDRTTGMTTALSSAELTGCFPIPVSKINFWAKTSPMLPVSAMSPVNRGEKSASHI